MPPRREFSVNSLDDIRRRYLHGGESCFDIARVYGVAKNTIRARLLDSGVRLCNAAAVISRKARVRPSLRLGTVWPEESRRKLSRAIKGHRRGVGRTCAPATIEKMRAAALRRCKDPEEHQQLRARAALGGRARKAMFPPRQQRAPRPPREKKPRTYRRPVGAALIRARQRARYKNLLKALLRRTRRPKTSRCAEILGYSRDHFVRHIESQFQSGMSWSERESFHVDHIIPIRVLIAHGVTDPRIVNGLSNLRPLPPRANRDKSGHYDESRWSEDYARILAGHEYEAVAL